MLTTPTARPAPLAMTTVLGPAVALIVLGTFVLFGVALAGPEILHNAAHDTRHAFAFPCH